MMPLRGTRAAGCVVRPRRALPLLNAPTAASPNGARASMTALFAARPNTTCISSARTGSTGCGLGPLGASPLPPREFPPAKQRVARLNPLTYARSWHRPFAPCSRSPIRTQSAAHTTFGSDVSSGGRGRTPPGRTTSPLRGTARRARRARARPRTPAQPPATTSSKSSATISSSDRHATAPPL